MKRFTVEVIVAVALLAMNVNLGFAAKRESEANLQKEAKVTKAAATATAEAKVPGGKIQSSELERERGKLIYSFDIKVPGTSGIEEVTVDAITGTVIAVAHESPEDEKKEAAAEAKEKAAKAAPAKR